MAKKKKGKKRSYGKAGKLDFDTIIDGLLAGGGGQIVQRWLGEWGHPVATLATGYLRNNQTFMNEGMRELGALLATKVPILGGGTSPYAGRNY